ncbi:hypothetical protein [Kosakonia sp. WA-90]|uniref:hypothetical protein n=1 Tax=Kosakonia sp. WA-90 TaxID=3153576 RepID=UPI00325CD7E9
MEGITFREFDNFALCCVDYFSDEIKQSLRMNLSQICHGSEQANQKRAMYNYNNTIKAFWDRYSSKAETTKKGMLGELLSHVIILNLFPRFEIVSPFFNLEERSIKKGFDILLYESSRQCVWITEVKSGEIHKDKDSTLTTLDLLNTARDDLKFRLAEQQLNHWQNAIHAAKIAIDGKKVDYKDVVIDILQDEGDLVTVGGAVSQDNNALLISALFHNVSEQVSEEFINEFSKSLGEAGLFKSFFVFSLQKGTLKNLEDFLRTEAGA